MRGIDTASPSAFASEHGASTERAMLSVRYGCYGAWNAHLTGAFSVTSKVATNELAGVSRCLMSLSWRSALRVPANESVGAKIERPLFGTRQTDQSKVRYRHLANGEDFY